MDTIPVPILEASCCGMVPCRTNSTLASTFNSPHGSQSVAQQHRERCHYPILPPKAIRLLNHVCPCSKGLCSEPATCPHFTPSRPRLCAQNKNKRKILVCSGFFLPGGFQMEMLWSHPREVFLVSADKRELVAAKRPPSLLEELGTHILACNKCFMFSRREHEKKGFFFLFLQLCCPVPKSFHFPPRSKRKQQSLYHATVTIPICAAALSWY